MLSLRAALSKGILAFDFTVGAGYDRYTSDPSFNFLLECQTTECVLAGGPGGVSMVADTDGTTAGLQPIAGELETAAWNVFGNIAFDLFVANLVAEVGYQKATDVIEADDLQSGRRLTEEELSGGKLFGSVGLRIAF